MESSIELDLLYTKNIRDLFNNFWFRFYQGEYSDKDITYILENKEKFTEEDFLYLFTESLYNQTKESHDIKKYLLRNVKKHVPYNYISGVYEWLGGRITENEILSKLDKKSYCHYPIFRKFSDSFYSKVSKRNSNICSNRYVTENILTTRENRVEFTKSFYKLPLDKSNHPKFNSKFYVEYESRDKIPTQTLKKEYKKFIYAHSFGHNSYFPCISNEPFFKYIEKEEVMDWMLNEFNRVDLNINTIYPYKFNLEEKKKLIYGINWEHIELSYEDLVSVSKQLDWESIITHNSVLLEKILQILRIEKKKNIHKISEKDDLISAMMESLSDNLIVDYVSNHLSINYLLIEETKKYFKGKRKYAFINYVKHLELKVDKFLDEISVPYFRFIYTHTNRDYKEYLDKTTKNIYKELHLFLDKFIEKYNPPK